MAQAEAHTCEDTRPLKRDYVVVHDWEGHILVPEVAGLDWCNKARLTLYRRCKVAADGGVVGEGHGRKVVDYCTLDVEIDRVCIGNVRGEYSLCRSSECREVPCTQGPCPSERVSRKAVGLPEWSMA